jgi:uncharacterized membrane protein YjgN (DUF898 family)
MNKFTFKGSGSEYFNIWIVNILLSIITLGFYTPWAKVRNLRYFYGNTQLGDTSFDYHATGKQLLIGYIIAFVLIVLFLSISQIAMIIIFALALPWIILRSMNFNMNMTSFSNVRFGFDGTLTTAYIIYLLYPLGIVVGIGILGYILFGVVFSSPTGVSMVIGSILIMGTSLISFSALKAKKTQFLINNMQYGQGRWITHVNMQGFVKIALKVFAFTIIGLAVVAILIFTLFNGADIFNEEALQLIASDPELAEILLQEYAGFIGLGYIMFLLFGIFTMAYLQVLNRNYLYSNTKLDGLITFNSSLKFTSLAWVLFTNVLIMMVTLGFGTPWTKVRMARLFVENTEISSNIDLSNYLSQKQQEQSAIADQIGDGFDMEVGINL